MLVVASISKVVYVICSVVLFTAPSGCKPTASDGYLHRIADPQSFPAFVHVPSPITQRESKFPLLLFLHGAGEAGKGGAELDRLKSYGATTPMLDLAEGTAIPALLKNFVVVAPQARMG
jgi:hypothetical protein